MGEEDHRAGDPTLLGYLGCSLGWEHFMPCMWDMQSMLRKVGGGEESTYLAKPISNTLLAAKFHQGWQVSVCGVAGEVLGTGWHRKCRERAYWAFFFHIGKAL